MQFTRLECGRQRIPARRLLALAAATFAIGACVDEPPAETGPSPAGQGFLPANPPPAVGCGRSGHVRGALHGALNAEIDWNADALHCEGMPRPDGRGARLRFAGAAGDIAIAIIIAIPALERATTASELPARVTMIDEGNGRFFSTADADNCWTDVDGQAPIDAGSERFVVDGRLYCIAPLPEVNGGAGVSITELVFRGLLDWGAG